MAGDVAKLLGVQQGQVFAWHCKNTRTLERMAEKWTSKLRAATDSSVFLVGFCCSGLISIAIMAISTTLLLQKLFFLPNSVFGSKASPTANSKQRASKQA
jgi:hypothetical protein